MSTIGIARTLKDNHFCKQQEGVRKAIERLLGSIFKKWQILYRLACMHDINVMDLIVKTYSILHKITVEERRSAFPGSRAVRSAENDEKSTDTSELLTTEAPEDAAAAANFWHNHSEGFEDGAHHFQLREALTNYIWATAAEGDGDEVLINC